MSAYTELLGHHLRSTLDLLATTPTSERVDYEEEDDMDPGLDFSGLHDPDSMRHILSACDYYLSDDSNDYSSDYEGYDPTQEQGWPWASHDLGPTCLGKVSIMFSYNPVLLKRLGTLGL
jgi:hypothetical protein